VQLPATCFECGDVGHISADCPNKQIDNRPPWCGICDRRTRQLWLNRDGTSVQRCPSCHRLRHKTLAQHRRCGECKAVVYEWDNNECGSHLMPGKPDERPPIERIHEITGRKP